MATRKTKAAPRRRPAPPQRIEVSFTDRVRNIAIWIGCGAAALALVGTLGTWWSQGPPVSTKTLDDFKGEVSRQLSTTKSEVVGHSDKNTSEVKGKVDAVNVNVEKLSRTVIRSQIENMEAQEASLVWSQRPQLLLSQSSIEKQLQERPGDQWLMQRKGEVENALRTLDSRIADARSRLSKLKEQF